MVDCLGIALFKVRMQHCPCEETNGVGPKIDWQRLKTVEQLDQSNARGSISRIIPRLLSGPEKRRTGESAIPMILDPIRCSTAIWFGVADKFKDLTRESIHRLDEDSAIPERDECFEVFLSILSVINHRDCREHVIRDVLR